MLSCSQASLPLLLNPVKPIPVQTGRVGLGVTVCVAVGAGVIEAVGVGVAVSDKLIVKLVETHAPNCPSSSLARAQSSCKPEDMGVELGQTPPFTETELHEPLPLNAQY